jgi:hypothetical protein
MMASVIVDAGVSCSACSLLLFDEISSLVATYVFMCPDQFMITSFVYGRLVLLNMYFQFKEWK